jgi:hypothetical protein
MHGREEVLGFVDFRWMSSYDVRGEELASEHLYFDQAELLGQLGLMPAP